LCEVRFKVKKELVQVQGCQADKDEKVAMQIAAFEALKFLQYIPPSAVYANLNRAPTSLELASQNSGMDTYESSAPKIPIISGGSLPPPAQMPAIPTPKMPGFISYKHSVLEFCRQIGYDPPKFEEKPYLDGALGSVYFTTGFVSTDVITHDIRAAQKRTPFPAAKAVRYIPLDEPFISCLSRFGASTSSGPMGPPQPLMGVQW